MDNALIIIYNIALYASLAMVSYFTLLGLIGLFCHKQKYKMVEDRQKFCIFVPCHNEEAVISATVENFAKFTYSKDLFDIYFVADNCKDNTANAIRETIAQNNLSNFYVMERNINDPKLKGKPHALNWGINQLEESNSFYEKYDMFMILDADNFADANILEHINSQYYHYREKKRPVMIQTYLDSKNKNNLIARGYFATYRITNGFWQLPKQKIGLNAAIGGTGFAVDTKFLQELGGYKCSSLTEDLEIQTIATLKGKRIVFNGNVRIYDEKPTGLRQSIVQRTRWAQGHWFIAFKYVGRLFISLFNPKQIKNIFRKIDNIIYLLGMLNYINIIIMFGLDAYFKIVNINVINPITTSIMLGVSCYLYFQLFIASIYDGTPKEKKYALIEFIPNVIAFTFYGWTYIYCAIIGLFKCHNQTVWKKTVHKVTTMQVESPPLKENSTESAEKVVLLDEEESKEIV